MARLEKPDLGSHVGIDLGIAVGTIDPLLSFRAQQGICLGLLFAQEKEGEIPRCARNDKIMMYFAGDNALVAI